MTPRVPIYVAAGAVTPFIGRGHPDFVPYGERADARDNPNLQTLMTRAVTATGVDPADVDCAWVSNFLGEVFAHQGHLGSLLAAAAPGLESKPITRVEAACASGAAAISSAVMSLQAGSEVALAVGVEVENTVRSRQGVEFMSLAAHVPEQRDIAFALFPWMFARRAKAWKERFGGSTADLDAVVAKAYRNARANPLALRHRNAVRPQEIASSQTFLEDPALRDHIRLLDCTDFTDGAAAVVLATAKGLQRLGIPIDACTEILGIGHSVRALGGDTDATALTNLAAAAAVAYRAADVAPADIHIAEVHDCFSIAEIQAMEALGFAPPGQGGALVRDGTTAIDGRLPVNTGGGLLGFGHPIGATGVKQVAEIHKQMTGRSGAYQIANRPQLGITANLGGDDRTGIVMIHRKT